MRVQGLTMGRSKPSTALRAIHLSYLDLPVSSHYIHIDRL